MSKANKNELYEKITERIVASLEAGVAPWRIPWKPADLPRNVEGYSYRGVNVFMLMMTQTAMGYGSPYWMSFRQAKARGGSVKKGEKGTMIVFWKMLHVRDEESDDPKATKQIPLLRYSTVFNLDQTEGVKLPKKVAADLEKIGEANDNDPIEAAEAIVDGYANRPAIRRTPGVGQAFYLPSLDVITVPALSDYAEPDEFYSTLFHEIGHSTGHRDRLDRFAGDATFGSHAYGREELIAEMTAAFLCGTAGIESTQDNSAAYLGSWIKTIREDVRAVVVAAGAAQRAADLVLGVQRGQESNDEQEKAA